MKFLVDARIDTQDVVRKPGAWCELPEAKVDWNSSNTNEDIARTLSGDGV